MAQNDEYVRLGYDTDEASLAKAKSSADSLTKKLEDIGGAAVKTSKGFKDLQEISATIGRGNNLDAVGRQFAELGKTLKDDNAALAKMVSTLSELGASTAEVDRATRAFKEMGAAQKEASAPAHGGGGFNLGRAESFASQAGSALRGIAPGGAADVVSATADLLQLGNVAKETAEATGLLTAGVGAAGTAFAAAAAPIIAVAAPLALVALALKSVKDSADDAAAAEKKRYDQEVADITKLSTLRAKAKTETSKQSADEVDQIKQQRDDQNKILADLQKRKAQVESDLATKVFEPGGYNKAQAERDQLNKEIQDTLANLDKLNKAFDDQVKTVDPLIAQYEEQAKAVADLVAKKDLQANADKLQAAGLDQIRQATEGKIATNVKEQAQIEANIRAASKQVDQEIDSNNKRIKDNNALIDNLVKLGPANEYAVAKTKELRDENAKLAADTDKLTSAVKPLIDAQENVAITYARVQFAAEQLAEGVGKKLGDAFKGLLTAGQEIIDRDKRLADVTRQYNDAVKKADQDAAVARAGINARLNDTLTGIDEQYAEKRADIQQKYNDKLIEIAQSAAEAAADNLKKLEQTRADLATGLADDLSKADRDAQEKELDIRIAAAREDEKATREHFERLADIRRNAADKEFELALNRDFAGLFASRRQTTRDINAENRGFNSETEARHKAEKQQEDDLKRSIASERRERQIAYQNALRDAQLAYKRDNDLADQHRKQQIAAAQKAAQTEQHNADVAHTTAINKARQAAENERLLLDTKIRNQRTAIENGYDAELKLANMFSKQRIEIEKQTQDALIAQAKRRLYVTSGVDPVQHKATGGWQNAGQWTAVNEQGSSGNESFTSGGKTTNLPGAGLFMPFQSGMVNSGNNNSKTTTLAPVFNITGGANPAQTAAAIEPVVYRVLSQLAGIN